MIFCCLFIYRHIYKVGRTKPNYDLQQALQLYNDAASNNHPVINDVNEPLIQSKQTSEPHFSCNNESFKNIPKVIPAI